jgi:hypothetical protein
MVPLILRVLRRLSSQQAGGCLFLGALGLFICLAAILGQRAAASSFPLHAADDPTLPPRPTLELPPTLPPRPTLELPQTPPPRPTLESTETPAPKPGKPATAQPLSPTEPPALQPPTIVLPISGDSYPPGIIALWATGLGTLAVAVGLGLRRRSSR